MGESEKQREEREIFARFAAAAGLDVDPESIRQPDPPDIACRIRGLGEVAFELTQIDDQSELREMKLFMRSQEFLHTELATFDAAIQETVRHSYASSIITIHFREQIDQRARRGVLAHIIRLLASHGTFEGDLGPLLAEWRFAVLGAEVTRLTTGAQGPRLLTPRGAWEHPVDLDRITSKVAKEASRRIAERLELLAYVRWGMSATDDPRDLQACLRERLANSTFARAWIFEVTSRRIIAIWEKDF